MALDMRTLLVVTGVIDCIIVVTMLAVHRSHKGRFKGTMEWFLCFLSNTVGNLLLATRGTVPDVVSIVIAHTLMTLSICLLVRACAVITGFKSSPLVLIIPTTAFFFFHLWYGIIAPSLFIRAIGATVMTLGGSLCASSYLWRARIRGSLSGFFFMSVMSTALGLRLVAIVATHYRGNWIINVPIDTWFMLTFLFVYIGLGFSYLRMIDGLAMQELSASNESNSLLFREMRHRTKNNLALIASLVSLQSDSVKDPDARAAFRVLESRLRTISSVYRILTTATTDQAADVRSYLASVVTGIRDSLAGGRRIEFSTSLESLSIGQIDLVPLGLIVNELVTNSVKYAFPDGRPGAVSVDFHVDGQGCVLSVADNGIGLPDGAENGKGIGLSLVRALAGQLQGTVSFHRSPDTQGSAGIDGGAGARCTVSFPRPASKSAAAVG